MEAFLIIPIPNYCINRLLVIETFNNNNNIILKKEEKKYVLWNLLVFFSSVQSYISHS